MRALLLLKQLLLETQASIDNRKEMRKIVQELYSKPEFVQERLARPETIPFYELPAKIDAARSFGLRADAFSMQLHSLIAMPFLLIAMTLIAATFSMRVARMGQSSAV